MSWLSNLFGLGNNSLKQALQQGAIVVDLRTAYEYDQGHVPRSLNIPIDRIRVSIERIKAYNKPVVLVCSAGNHCYEAADILRQAGVPRVFVGGSWQSVMRLKN